KPARMAATSRPGFMREVVNFFYEIVETQCASDAPLFSIIPNSRKHSDAAIFQRQPDRERDAAAFIVDDVDFAAVVAHDAPHDQQPETRSRGFGCKVRIENLAHVFR